MIYNFILASFTFSVLQKASAKPAETPESEPEKAE